METSKPVAKVSSDKARQKLAEAIADYVETHARYADLSKREVVVEAVRVLTDDIGAAQQFVYAIGLEVDLYDGRAFGR